MLAYAADRRPTGRASSPTLALVIAGHAALLALVMTARGDLPLPRQFDPIDVTFVEPIKPPPPEPQPQPPRQPVRSVADRPAALIPLPSPNPLPLDPRPQPQVVPTPDIGPAIVLPPSPRPAPLIARKAARFVTPPDAIRPPYPESKRRLEEEANLRLALDIDPRGRVVAVAPVGTADPVFLEAARRHILRYWRYQPASEDGQAVASRINVTLRFRLDE